MCSTFFFCHRRKFTGRSRAIQSRAEASSYATRFTLRTWRCIRRIDAEIRFCALLNNSVFCKNYAAPTSSPPTWRNNLACLMHQYIYISIRHVATKLQGLFFIQPLLQSGIVHSDDRHASRFLSAHCIGAVDTRVDSKYSWKKIAYKNDNSSPFPSLRYETAGYSTARVSNRGRSSTTPFINNDGINEYPEIRSDPSDIEHAREFIRWMPALCDEHDTRSLAPAVPIDGDPTATRSAPSVG